MEREKIREVLSAHIKSGEWAIELEDDLLQAMDSCKKLSQYDSMLPCGFCYEKDYNEGCPTHGIDLQEKLADQKEACDELLKEQVRETLRLQDELAEAKEMMGGWCAELAESKEEVSALQKYVDIAQELGTELAEAKKKIEKEPCCVSCIEDKNSGYGDDIEGCCCYHGGHKIFDTLRKENEEAWLKALLSKLPEKKPSPKGRDCNCEAHSYNECGCNADWSDNDGFNSAIDIIREKLNKKRT